MRNKLVIVLAVLIVGIGGIFFLETFTQPSTSLNFNNMILSPLVEGCAETDDGMATRYSAEEIEQEPKIDVIGNKILYFRSINHLCCRKAEIEKDVENSIINIYEVWSGIGCRCMCFSEIGAELQNVPLGTYKVNVYEKGTKALSEEPMEENLIISQNIVIQ